MIEHYVGIDPGKKGAIVWIPKVIGNQQITSWVIPTIGKELNLHGLNRIISLLVGEKTHVFVEAVHAIYGSAAGATFAFGEVFGAIKGILTAQNARFTLVQPKTWQKVMYQGIPEIRKPSITVKKGKCTGQKRKGPRDTKAMSLLAAQQLFPQVDLRANDRCKKPHDGIVDALLLVEYGRRLLIKGQDNE